MRVFSSREGKNLGKIYTLNTTLLGSIESNSIAAGNFLTKLTITIY